MGNGGRDRGGGKEKGGQEREGVLIVVERGKRERESERERWRGCC